MLRVDARVSWAGGWASCATAARLPQPPAVGVHCTSRPRALRSRHLGSLALLTIPLHALGGGGRLLGGGGLRGRGRDGWRVSRTPGASPRAKLCGLPRAKRRWLAPTPQRASAEIQQCNGNASGWPDLAAATASPPSPPQPPVSHCPAPSSRWHPSWCSWPGRARCGSEAACGGGAS